MVPKGADVVDGVARDPADEGDVGRSGRSTKKSRNKKAEVVRSVVQQRHQKTF